VSTVSLRSHAPNEGLEPTPSSVRSAPAFGRGSGLALDALIHPGTAYADLNGLICKAIDGANLQGRKGKGRVHELSTVKVTLLLECRLPDLNAL
jgi:hypothetical protein